MLAISAAAAAPTDIIRYPNGGFSFSFGARIPPVPTYQYPLTPVQAPLLATYPIHSQGIPNQNRFPIQTPSIQIPQPALFPTIIPQNTPVVSVQTSVPSVSYVTTKRPLTIAHPETSTSTSNKVFAGIPPSPLIYMALAMTPESAQALTSLGKQ